MAERTNLSMGIGRAICDIDLRIVPDDRIHNVVIPELRRAGVIVNINSPSGSPDLRTFEETNNG